MKAITTQAIIEGIRARKDGSLGLTVTTPELIAQEKALFMELQGLVLEMTLQPSDEPVEAHRVDVDIEQKSQSQRMRNVLYILWTQSDKSTDFPEFYRRKTESIIEWLKEKIL